MKRLSRLVYRIIRGLVWLFYPKPTFEGLENLPDGPCVIVGNHAQMNGPIIAELYIPGDRAIWCAGKMMHLSEVPDYAYRDFWSKKPAGVRWFYRLLSFAIAPLSVCVFNNARCIGVYHDMRIMSTLRESVNRLADGTRIIIFPEHNVPYNAILCAFQDRFIDIARLYAHRTAEQLTFVPMYVAPALGRVILGKPIGYDDGADPDRERQRVCGELMNAITAIAVGLPRHRVVPYPNMAKKAYPYNIPDGEENR